MSRGRLASRRTPAERCGQARRVFAHGDGQTISAREVEPHEPTPDDRKLEGYIISSRPVEPRETTPDDPRLAGRLEREGLVIGDQTFDVALGGGGELRLSLDDLVPYSHMIVGLGKKIS